MKAAIFDLFGTLAYIDQPTFPYQRILTRATTAADARAVAMTSVCPPAKLAAALGAPLSTDELAQVEREIRDEVERIRLYPETRDALAVLREAGFVIIVSSNLAKPYGQARALLSDLVDYWNFSFDTGVLKPDSQMFTGPAAAFGIAPEDCVVIGDSLKADREGARAAGMRFVLVDREGRHAVKEGLPHLSHVLDCILDSKG